MESPEESLDNLEKILTVEERGFQRYINIVRWLNFLEIGLLILHGIRWIPAATIYLPSWFFQPIGYSIFFIDYFITNDLPIYFIFTMVSFLSIILALIMQKRTRSIVRGEYHHYNQLIPFISAQMLICLIFLSPFNLILLATFVCFLILMIRYHRFS